MTATVKGAGVDELFAPIDGAFALFTHARKGAWMSEVAKANDIDDIARYVHHCCRCP